MKVKMKVQITGMRDGQRWPAIGGEIDLPDDEGAHACAQGWAEPVAQKPEPEKRVAPKKAAAKKAAPKKDD